MPYPTTPRSRQALELPRPILSSQAADAAVAGVAHDQCTVWERSDPVGPIECSHVASAIPKLRVIASGYGGDGTVRRHPSNPAAATSSPRKELSVHTGGVTDVANVAAPQQATLARSLPDRTRGYMPVASLGPRADAAGALNATTHRLFP